MPDYLQVDTAPKTLSPQSSQDYLDPVGNKGDSNPSSGHGSSKTKRKGTKKTPPESSHPQLSIYIPIVSIAFLMTAGLGVALGVVTFTNTQTAVNDLARQIRQGQFQAFFQVTQKSVDDCLSALSLAVNNYNAVQTANAATSTSPIENPNLFWDYYNIGIKFPWLTNIGASYNNIGTRGSSQPTSFSIFLPASGNMIQISDATTKFNPITRAITGTNLNSTLSISEESIPGTPPPSPPPQPFSTFCGSNVAVPGSPYFTAPLYSKPQSSFLIPVIHHTWKNFPAGSPSYGTPDTCTFVTLSLTAIETSLKAIPVTPNSILSIVDGTTGNMIATLAANASFNVNNQGTLYPALANPNKMVSASVSYLVTKWSSFNTIQSIRKLGRTEGSFVGSDGDWGEVFVSAAWISDISLGLNWLLIQSVPASDFGDTDGKKNLQSVVIVVVVVSVVALLLGLVVSWRIVSPLRMLAFDMEYAAKLDFAAFTDEDLKRRSIFSEIARAQASFNKLLIKLSDTADKNLELAANVNASTTSLAPPNLRLSSTGPGILRTSKAALPVISNRRDPPAPPAPGGHSSNKAEH